MKHKLFLYLILFISLSSKISTDLADSDIIDNSSLNKLDFNKEPEDHQCELKTSIILKYLLNQTILPTEYNEFYKFIFYTGTGPNDLGDYIGCNKMNISKYHTISINKSISPSPIQIGLCYLKECNVEYLNTFKSHMADILKKYKNITVDPQSLVIYDPDGNLQSWKNSSIIGVCIVMVILGILIILNVLQFIVKLSGTTSNERKKLLFDINDEKDSQKNFLENDLESLKSNKNSSAMIKFLKLFDFQQNMIKLFEVKKDDNISIEVLKIFDGLKFIAAFWIVWGHTMYYSITRVGVKNTTEIIDLIKSLPYFIWLSTHYAVDIFFFISGFLMYLHIQKYFNRKINAIKLYSLAVFNRTIRLYPLYLFILIGMTYIMPFISNGPNYYLSEFNNKGCRSNFWVNLLFINNFYFPNGNHCATHTWYIANDMKFFLIFTFIYLYLNNFKKVRNTIITIIFISTRIYCFMDAMESDYINCDFAHNHNSKKDFFKDIYVKPWLTNSAYIIGIYFCELFIETPIYLTGCHNETEEKKEKNIIRKFNEFLIHNNFICFILFVFALILLIGELLLGTYINNTLELSVLLNAIYIAFGTPIFITGVAIILHLTFLGKLNFLKAFLSIRFFSSMSKLLYGVYLIHIYVMNIYLYSRDSVPYLSMLDYTYMGIGIFTVTCMISSVIIVLIESPIVNFMKSSNLRQ